MSKNAFSEPLRRSGLGTHEASAKKTPSADLGQTRQCAALN
jgi:hypothetical protein